MQNYDAVLAFFREVDNDFPVPVSSKTDLRDLADKFCRFGTMCCEYSKGEIAAMVAGYIENTPEDLGYISLVAVAEEFRSKGLATKLLMQFLGKASEKGLRGVHVYTHSTNNKAIDMYKKIGFIPYKPEDELRPQDVHLIYLF